MSPGSADNAARATRQSVEYREALDFLYQRINYERRPATQKTHFRLRRMRKLLERLGNPEKSLKIAHIAGTKGKGSTASMVASMLQATGHRTGLYTSPHLQHIEDRWRIDSRSMPPQEMIQLVESLRPLVEELDGNPATAPTFFELTTAMAFVHFFRQGVSWAVVEVGLGGRLDSTNVVHPEVTAITTIGFDHQAILGNTLPQIAGEKAGIIKPGIPVVSGVLDPGAQAVIAEVARTQQAPLRQVHRDFSYQVTEHPDGWSTCFNFVDREGSRHEDIQLTLVGDHQAHNAATALAMVDELCALGSLHMPWEARRSGLLNAQSPARMQVIARHPTIVLDVAHNVDSIQVLIAALSQRILSAEPTPGAKHEGPKIAVVFACSNDKDWKAMLSLLADFAHLLILTRFHKNPRCVQPEELAAIAMELVPRVFVRDLPQEAVELAVEEVGSEGLVVICGSFFLAAEVLDFLENSPIDLT